ncbi:beta-propeller domain-containing protein [Alkalihalobacillus sp. TS-13]|uniref:beta-propeller domain-containing protein n=1 Tax=Alkalihalobacillus sp. TS-13 TaxID=2842455 RepID=UPI001C87718B|nr:beta-propeller domain-containing protein [Alkalihalobacillus sp. TS-13]
MKKWWLLTGLVVIIAIGYFYWTNQPKVLNAWDENQDTPVVLQNKTWKILFSKKIDVKTIKEDTIYVTDSDGERQNVSFTIDDDQRTVLIQPPETGYNLSSSYFTLHVENGIRSTQGRKIKEIPPMKFIVERTLPVIGSKEKLNDYFLQAIRENKQKTRLFSRGDAIATEESSDASASAKADSSGSGDFSETNVQVDGVDEADIVKNDGRYVYQVLQDRVIITKAYPASEMKKVAAITFKEHELSPQELILYKDRLVIIGHSLKEMQAIQNRGTSAKDVALLPIHHTLKAYFYDIKDRSKPILEREVEIEGSYFTARRSDNYLYLISNHHPNYWPLAEKKDQGKNIDLRPKVRDSADNDGSKYIDYEKINYFSDSKDTNFTIISSIPIDKPRKKARFTTYLGSGNQLYMSKENIFIAVNTYPDLTTDTRVEFTPDTVVYKFTFNEEVVKFKHSTEIEGTVLNQFSMDEYRGKFRVATTSGNTWNDDNPSSNHLFIFDEKLRKIGEITDLAQGERIYSARFMQDRIYIVTFKQVDPLFVIDASDPTNPKVKGELKIPGFSNYLHPYDENHLIGFGQNTKLVENSSVSEPFVQTDGIKISIFDVSDMNNPIEKHTEIINGNGTYSLLNHDHKSLLFDKQRNIFAFPIHIYNYEEGKAQIENAFQGAMIYNIDTKDGFNLAAKLSHTQTEGEKRFEQWETDIQRLLYIQNTIYSLSRSKIVAHELSTFEKIGQIDLRD